MDLMKRFLPLFLLAALGATPIWGDATKDSQNQDLSALKKLTFHWKQSSNSDGLSLYWSKVEGSQVIAFRGEGIVDAPIEKVASIIIDTTRATEWIDSLVSSNVVRNISPTEFIEYDHVGISFPFDTVMSDRDFVS